jgi:hypothetical protein
MINTMIIPDLNNAVAEAISNKTTTAFKQSSETKIPNTWA